MAEAAPIDDVLLRRQVMLQRLTVHEVAQFNPVLRKIDAAIRSELSGDELTDFSKARLEAQLKGVQSLLGGIYGDYQKHLIDNLVSFASSEARFSAKAMGNTVLAQTTLPTLTQIRSALLENPLTMTTHGGGQMLEGFISEWTSSEQRGVIGAIRKGVFMGQPNALIVRAIRGTRARGYQDGLLDTTARKAATIVHTAMQHASSQARQATIDANADIVKQVKWVSTLDNRTCVQCMSMDGLLFDVDKGARPPIHPNCRCTAVPVLSGKYAAFNNAGSTRASVGATGGKQVPVGQDYYTWLKDQPEEFQIVALGKTRAKLFRDGGLTAKRFAELQVDRNLEPLTLIEMEKLDPVAFMRAGINL
jgi:SPP1 gp7 family putative phage head morphogenesis protein